MRYATVDENAMADLAQQEQVAPSNLWVRL
jgi:hypothetical protein